MTAPVHSRGNWQLLEWVLMILVVAGFIRMAWLVVSVGYFPQPFFYDADDTFRDWFSTAVWAHDKGAYDSWLTVYPPLSFAILKIAGLQSCYEFTYDKVVRDCDWVGIGVIHAIYVFNIFLTAKVFMKLDRRTALPRSFALVAGMPMLFGLERGNLILLCYTFVLLGYGPLLRSARLRWLFIALAVNLKIYLIAAIPTQLLRRRWMWFEGVMISIVLVYLISYAIYGAGTPLELYNNLLNFGSDIRPNQILDIWFSNTYNSLYYVLVKSDAPVSLFLGSRVVAFAAIAIPTVVHTAQVLIILAALATWLRPEVVPPFRLTFFGIALAMITTETSGYTQPIMFFFIFMESWKGWARPLAIATCYILCIPGDIIISSTAASVQFSYIAGSYVPTEQGIALGMFLRPLLLLLPAYFLGLKTIRDVWLDIRYQGWRDRWRFRHDWPLLPGILRPRPPAKAHAT